MNNLSFNLSKLTTNTQIHKRKQNKRRLFRGKILSNLIIGRNLASALVSNGSQNFAMQKVTQNQNKLGVIFSKFYPNRLGLNPVKIF